MSGERDRDQHRTRGRDRHRRHLHSSPSRKRHRSPIHERQPDPKRRKWSGRPGSSHSPLSSGERTLEGSGHHTYQSHSGGRSFAGSKERYKDDEMRGGASRRGSGGHGSGRDRRHGNGHSSGSDRKHGSGHNSGNRRGSGSGKGHGRSGVGLGSGHSGKRERGDGPKKESVAGDISSLDVYMAFTASLPKTFYSSGNNGVSIFNFPEFLLMESFLKSCCFT